MRHELDYRPEGSASIDTTGLFELDIELPSDRLASVAAGLVGFSRRRERLGRLLRLISDTPGLEQWSRRFYGQRLPLCDLVRERHPLIIFHGDVGTGKTATAEAMADALVRETDRQARLYKLSTRVRGTGRVGQMSTLINQAFATVSAEAGRSRMAILILDEADSLAASREEEHSHHEDRVAVNTLIQKIDEIRRFQGRVLVFLCTNRFTVLDPAIVRRAAFIEAFARPNEAERAELFRTDLSHIGLSRADLDQLVHVTGPRKCRPGWTYSDLRTRLYPEAMARAYPDRQLSAEDFLAVARELSPSPSLDAEPADER